MPLPSDGEGVLGPEMIESAGPWRGFRVGRVNYGCDDVEHKEEDRVHEGH